MDVRLVAAVTGGEVNVAALCRELGVSRQTFYEWHRRYQRDGLAGLEPRSSTPKTSPRATPADVEEAVVALRTELSDAGLDSGPATIQWHLGRRGMTAVPSVSTVWRILVRRGLVISQPRKRPKSSWCRFEAPAPNHLWQADATKVVIVIGQVEILTFLDDHSRVVTGCRAVMSATTDNTWEAFWAATQTWGVPVGQLSDNGLNFSGRLRGFEVAFEINLRAAGVRPITSRGYHPQTCGKVERFQQTLKKWLRKQPMANDLADLQEQLDRFITFTTGNDPTEASAASPPSSAGQPPRRPSTSESPSPLPNAAPPPSSTTEASSRSHPG